MTLYFTLAYLLKVGDSRFMTCTKPVQPQIPLGLDDQRSILNQLYRLAFNTATSREELEIAWDFLSHEKHPNIVVHFLPRNKDL